VSNDIKRLTFSSPFGMTLAFPIPRVGFYGKVTLKFSVQDGMMQLVEECNGRKHR